jgi:hypothetical protein
MLKEQKAIKESMIKENQVVHAKVGSYPITGCTHMLIAKAKKEKRTTSYV